MSHHDDEFSGAEPRRNRFNPYWHAAEVARRIKLKLCVGCGYKPDACTCPAQCEDCGRELECVTLEDNEPILCPECNVRRLQAP